MKTKIVIALLGIAAVLAWAGVAGAQTATPSSEGPTAERGDRVGFEWRLGCLCRELRTVGTVWYLSHGVENHADRQYR